MGRKRKTHEEFVNEMKEVNPSFIIIGKYQGDNKHIDVECEKHHIWSALPTNLRKGRGCPYCYGRKTWTGYNDIATTHPEFVKYFKNKDEAKMYSAGSHKRIIVVCPDCGEEFSVIIKDMIRQGFSCRSCSDNISYPNKFARAFFNQIPVNNLKFEYKPKWANGYIYDVYFEYFEKKYIVEMDGEFHYTESRFKNKTLKGNIIADKEKNRLAYENNVILIRIDCRKSELEYIKNNIIKSELYNLFDLCNIDWNYCNGFALGNIAKKICDFYNSLDLKVTTRVMEEFNLSRNAVCRYLKRGAELNWCDYNPKKIVREKQKKYRNNANFLKG